MEEYRDDSWVISVWRAAGRVNFFAYRRVTTAGSGGCIRLDARGFGHFGQEGSRTQLKTAEDTLAFPQLRFDKWADANFLATE